MDLMKIYNKLFEMYGEKVNGGWWPVLNERNKKFEIIVGAILTQNTSWKNVQRALDKLNDARLLDAEKILKIEEEKLKELIKSAGFYNQKARRLKVAAEFFLNNENPLREDFLKLKGIGKETADSILLYAYDKPVFVIDAYTKRMFSCLLKKQSINMNLETYDEWQNFFHCSLAKNADLFKKFHGLIVEFCKDICTKKGDCSKCIF